MMWRPIHTKQRKEKDRGKHLTLDQRITIQVELERNTPIKAIARKIGKGRARCRVFYCDPLHTNQKSQCERNHEYIRCVLPKGSSFDALTQADMDRVLSHVNSYARPGLDNRRPVDVVSTPGPRSPGRSPRPAPRRVTARACRES